MNSENSSRLFFFNVHYSDVIMSAMVSQIISFVIVYSNSGAGQRKHQISASLAFVRGIHQWPVNTLHKGPVTWKMFPFDDDIMLMYDDVRTWKKLLLCEGISPVTNGFPQKWFIMHGFEFFVVSLNNFFNKFPVIQDALILMWCLCDDILALTSGLCTSGRHQWPLLLTWINFNSSMDK